MRIVIIGNGVAGIEAALAVRRQEPSWSITIVSEESDHFFSRTALMWVFAGQLSHRDIEPFERDLYARERFERVRARAVGVDTVDRRVLLAGGHDPLPYDRLLLACGSRPRPAPFPGADLAGVGYFVTLQDLEWLEREVHAGPAAGRPPRADAHLAATAEGSPYAPRRVASEMRRHGPRRAVVIGGGLVGVEAVEVLLAAGLPTTFVLREHCWPVALDPREARWVTDRMTEHGVDVLLGERVREITGDAYGVVTTVRTDGSEREADLVVIAIGVVPNTEWLCDSGVELDASGGVVVDRALATSAPGVFAAGDCAAVLHTDGARRPEQLWYTARDQGRVAGRALAGEGVSYARGEPYNSAKLMDIEHTTAGTLDAEGSETWFWEERGAVRSTIRIAHASGRVRGFNMLGRRWDHEVLLRWIAEERPLSFVLAHLEEARFDTELVPPPVIPTAERPWTSRDRTA